MGCASHRKKQTQDFADQKWDYINLQDFKSKGCGPGLAYVYLWFMLILSIAVYAVDSFTAINLLAFNRWSSQINPAIPIDVSKWIFSTCILLSFVNLAFEGVRAYRVMKRENVAECFLDGLAARWESIRFGSGQGWRRFLVFAELTKSRKGSEYVALFTYFSFQSWIRVIFCSGPRQVVNALTLRSVYVSKLAPQATSVDGAIIGFFDKIKALASEDYRQALILSGMGFTLVVWIFSALFLLMAVLFYVFFLFHWIPRADGGLTGYCERKVNKKLLRIVTTKVNKALAKGQAERLKADLELARRTREKTPYLERAATLPRIPNLRQNSDDTLPPMPTVGCDDHVAQVPDYTSRPSSPSNADPGFFGGMRPLVQRNGTASSASSFSSRAPLVSSAAEMGYGPCRSPEPSLPDIDYYSDMKPPSRPGTSHTDRSYSPRRGAGGPSPQGHPLAGSPLRAMTASPALTDHAASAYRGSPARTMTNHFIGSYATSPTVVGPAHAGHDAHRPYSPFGRQSPAPSPATYRQPFAPPPPSWDMPSPTGQYRFQGNWQHPPPSRAMIAAMPQYDMASEPYDEGMRGRQQAHDTGPRQNPGYF